LLSDGQGNSFTWNERNQLSAIAVPTATGTPVTELLQYDASGRRQHLDIYNRAGTNFLYDGLNPVQEQNVNGAETANLLTGLGLDEILTRTDSSGAMGFLTDQIGSTYGLVNSSGALQTTYTYGPFGATSASGTANGNPYQFTGRELDPNSGLYFMRNRYYSPTLQRFISPDPIGIAGGDANLYAYARNNPTNLIDPAGLFAIGVGDPADMGSVGQYIRMQGDSGSSDSPPGACDGPCGDIPGVQNAPFTPNIGPLQIQGGMLPVEFWVPFQTLPENPAESPGQGFVRNGRNFWHPPTGQSLHPDPGHDFPKGPHYDWHIPGPPKQKFSVRQGMQGLEFWNPEVDTWLPFEELLSLLPW
jgi:RHS repeat-associated protein